jgi:predicted lipoprotein with Yx(FWY)xxD motif
MAMMRARFMKADNAPPPPNLRSRPRVSHDMRNPLALIPLAALALAGCGAAAGRPASAPVATTAAAKHAVVKTRSTSLGTILVDSKGRTLYLFRKDTGRRSHCSGSCAQAWPPLTTHLKPRARGGARQSMLSTSRRRNGAKQVLYNGHPLYRYAFDGAAGDTNGQGSTAFGARWFVVAPSGKAVTSSSTPSGSPYPY